MHLDWDGCFNVRDLGGLPTVDGRVTRTGAVVRADALDGLSAAGWTALLDHGVRTVVSTTACARSSTCATTTSGAPTRPRARPR
jgi:hypothetical protein